jgi:hypothetical protein
MPARGVDAYMAATGAIRAGGRTVSQPDELDEREAVLSERETL